MARPYRRYAKPLLATTLASCLALSVPSFALAAENSSPADGPSSSNANPSAISQECVVDDISITGGVDLWALGLDEGASDVSAFAFDSTSSLSSPSIEPMDLSEELLYFTKYESGCNYDQGLSYYDGYYAVGYFGFDSRYGLGDLMHAIYDYDPNTFACLAIIGDKYGWDTDRPTRENNQFSEFGNDLNAAWHGAYAANPTLFSQLQNGWAYSKYYSGSTGVRDALRALGINLDNRADCVKGLAWGMAVLFGPGGGAYYVNQGLYYGANWFFHNAKINDSMTDTELVTTLCNFVVENVAQRYSSQPEYHEGWQNRYRKELADCLEYLAKDPADNKNNETIASSKIAYRTHVQDVGWQAYSNDGNLAGTTGKGLRLEAIRIQKGGLLSDISGDIEYSVHVEDYGWLAPVTNGDLAGTTGESKRLEAIRINLTSELLENYDVYYRVHAQDIGWMGWAKNGASAGTAGYGYRLEAIQLVILDKGASLEGVTFNETTAAYNGVTSVVASSFAKSTDTVDAGPSVTYSTHVENEGWQPKVIDGAMAGTTGKALRLEGITLSLGNAITDCYSGSIRYRTHVENLGWEEKWTSDGATSGTVGEALRLEGIQIELTGDVANHYDVYYRVHAQDIGWMGWAKNGERAGTEGYARRLEGIQVVLVKKDVPLDGVTKNATKTSFEGITSLTAIAFEKASPANDALSHPCVSYSTHVQDEGWQSARDEGEVAGTTGSGLRLEGIKLSLTPNLLQAYSGSIRYRTHVESIGWEENWTSDGATSGTVGEALRLEGIQIELMGDVAKHCDVYYRVHAQDVGWMGWAKNGESAGTEGYARRLEGIQVVIVPKNASLDGVTANCQAVEYLGIISATDEAFQKA